jgi:Protein of unknown function (DUF1275)
MPGDGGRAWSERCAPAGSRAGSRRAGAGRAGAGRAGAGRAGVSARLLLTAMATEAVFVGGGAVVAFVVPAVGHGWPRYLVIALLAFAMGVRNATIRRLAVPDLTTTVLTMTLTGLAADSSLAGGDNHAAVRRTAAVVAMLAGAVAGAALYLHRGRACRCSWPRWRWPWPGWPSAGAGPGPNSTRPGLRPRRPRQVRRWVA